MATAKKAARAPKIGDDVAHDGCWPGHEDAEYGGYRIVAVSDEGIVTFENARYRVSCARKELERATAAGINAWYLEGRLFSAEQRRAIRTLWDWPPEKALPDDAALMAKLEDQGQLGTVDQVADAMFLALEQRRGAERVDALVKQGHKPEAIAAAAKELKIDLSRLHGREQRQILAHLQVGGK